MCGVIDVNVGVVRVLPSLSNTLANFGYDDISSRMQTIVHRDSRTFVIPDPNTR